MRTSQTHRAADTLHQGAPAYRQWRDGFLERFSELFPDDPKAGDGKVYRTVQLDHTRAKKDQRTIEAVLATGADVQRRGYVERLQMTPEAVDLSRVKDMNGLPLIWMHDPTRHLGFAENVRVYDGALRARLRFSDTEEALEKWAAIEDGTLRSLSIGYVREEDTWQDRGQGEPPLVISTRWTPYEASVVTIPADTKARMGRALDLGLVDSPPPEFSRMRRRRELVRQLDLAAWNAEDVDGLAGALERAQEAVMHAESDDDLEDARRAIEELAATGETGQADNWTRGIHDLDQERRNVTTTRRNHLSKRTTTMKQEFSLCRALAAQIDPASAARAGYEIEVEQELRSRTGRTPTGMLVPETALMSRTFDKATEGADVIATNLYSDMYIEALRPRLAVGRLGAMILTDLQGDVQIPRKTGDATAYWIAGDGADALTESTPTTDNITMAPKTVGGRVILSRKMILQATPAAEQLVRESLMSAIAQAIDKQAMIGDGLGNTPTGVLNVSGIGSNTYANGGSPSFGDIVDLEGELMADDADTGTLGYVAHSGIASTMKKTDVGTDTGIFVWTATGEGEGRMNGYRALVSNNLTAGYVLFGNWRDLILAFWSGVDIVVDPYSRAAYGDVIITAMQDLDVKVRHAESFAELKEAAP